MARPFVDPRFGVTLRRLRQERGLSLRAMAQSAAFGTSYLHDLEAGAREPTVATARHLDEVLGVGGALAALVVEAPAPVADKERLAHAVAHPERLDLSAVESLATILAHLRRLEDSVGSSVLVAGASHEA